MIKMWKLAILLSFLPLLEACSIQSTQFDLLMSLINPGQGQAAPEDLTWTMSWSGENYTLYPVILADNQTTIFTTEEGDKFVAFDGFQVIMTGGLVVKGENIRIEKTDFGLEYSVNQELLASHPCEDFASTLINGNTVWLQECNLAEESYTNQIIVNDKNAITVLQFKIHPEYPMVILTPDNIFDFR